ncbi:hypothetical protein EDD36DRAFT_475380 [Exophiala viscosa]|uniref:Zn(2)-C6 fungal-type domain-containing protein n=1 Tax=Exophiala viscosa TaxID=2486360 RepID=A0AAN6DY07_9EURO|nr:hypothetical protein EDD36DRAFT_475380 [Exophiala viscosa]
MLTLWQCDICSRCFARSEHLARHRRTRTYLDVNSVDTILTWLLVPDTKEKPFTCPYCRRSFQRSDVKAVHVKKCHAAPSDRCDGDEAKEGSARRRVRRACYYCRKRKMRCDGCEPCGPCQSIAADCHYKPTAAASSSAPSQPSHADDATGAYQDQIVDDYDMNIGDDEGSVSLAFTVPQSNLGNGAILAGASLNAGVGLDPSLEAGMESIQSTHAGAIPLPFSGQPAFPTYDSMNSEVQDMSISHGNLLYPFPDPSGVNESWQMPSVNSHFWFDGSDFTWSDGLFNSNSPILDHVLPSSMQSLTAAMQEYFDRKSRAPSPSLNKASKMWYSAPPNLDDHNRDIIRVFLKLFRRHIPETFSLFKDSAVTRKGRAEYTLAMAAIGGLFCTVPGSAEVAKSMYNDARRLLLASFNTMNVLDDLSASVEDRLTTVRTFILLELYGLCSGDKRSYEFVEAFHGNLIYSVQQYSQAFKVSDMNGRKEDESARLLEALYILECYRVIIMQCPPTLSWHHPDSFAASPLPGTQIHRLQSLIVDLTRGAPKIKPDTCNEFSLTSLAYLSTFLWPAIYPRQNSYGIENVVIESLLLGKSDFVELACDTWLRSLGQRPEPSHLVVYHMMNIMLHTNLTVLQSFAHSPPGSAARDPKRSLVAREVHGWAQSRHYKTARWHAENMLSSIEGAFVTSLNRSEAAAPHQISSRSSFSTTEPRRLPFEAPHVPYAMYYATLVLWSGATLEECAGTSSVSAQALIARGERILSLHKVHIAQLLARVLNEVK